MEKEAIVALQSSTNVKPLYLKFSLILNIILLPGMQ